MLDLDAIEEWALGAENSHELCRKLTMVIAELRDSRKNISDAVKAYVPTFEAESARKMYYILTTMVGE